jgi:hypothetical protein
MKQIYVIQNKIIFTNLFEIIEMKYICVIKVKLYVICK